MRYHETHKANGTRHADNGGGDQCGNGKENQAYRTYRNAQRGGSVIAKGKSVQRFGVIQARQQTNDNHD